MYGGTQFFSNQAEIRKDAAPILCTWQQMTDNLFKVCCAAGLSPSEFWMLTHKEVCLYIEGRKQLIKTTVRQQQRDMYTLAGLIRRSVQQVTASTPTQYPSFEEAYGRDEKTPEQAVEALKLHMRGLAFQFKVAKS